MAIFAVALSVFRESVRDRVFYNLLLFAVLLVGASVLVGQMTAGQDLKIIKDLGLSATSLFGLFIAVFVGIGLVWKEVERRSAYSLIAKPVRRSHLVLGKYVGLAFTLFVNVAVMALVLYAVLAYIRFVTPWNIQAAWEAPALDPALLEAFLLIYVQLLVVTAIALFFSTFSSPILSAALTFGLYTIGHFNADLKHFDTIVTSTPLAWLLRVLYYLLPNLAPFNIGAAIVHGKPVAPGFILLTIAYALVYITFLLVGATWIFSRRDIQVTIWRRLAPVVAGVALVATFVGLVLWRDAAYGEPAPGDSVLYLRSGEAVRRMSLSFSPLVADLYWVRTVQYYGGTRLSADPSKRYDLLYPMLDIATTLDPRFNIAYRFGAIYLAEDFPGGAGRPDLAVALLQKGFRANPDRWQYLQDIGFVYYWWVGDYRTAAEWFRKGSEIPGAPWWLKPMAAVTLVQGGDRHTSRQLWEAMLQSADNDWIRTSARQRLAQIDALDAIDQLNAIVASYRSRTGRNPSSWADLVGARWLRATPTDPTGVPFTLDPTTGSVWVAPQSSLNPLPVGSRADGGNR